MEVVVMLPPHAKIVEDTPEHTIWGWDAAPHNYVIWDGIEQEFNGWQAIRVVDQHGWDFGRCDG